MTYNEKHMAQDAAMKAFRLSDPQLAMVLNFCVMHNGNEDDPNYKLAEAIDSSEDHDRVLLMLEYVSTYCKRCEIAYSTIEILGRADKCAHGRKNEYHYCFRALVTVKGFESK